MSDHAERALPFLITVEYRWDDSHDVGYTASARIGDWVVWTANVGYCHGSEREALDVAEEEFAAVMRGTLTRATVTDG